MKFRVQEAILMEEKRKLSDKKAGKAEEDIDKCDIELKELKEKIEDLLIRNDEYKVSIDELSKELMDRERKIEELENDLENFKNLVKETIYKKIKEEEEPLAIKKFYEAINGK